MKNQLYRGGMKYISFIILDLICLAFSNAAAVQLYMYYNDRSVSLTEHAVLAAYTLVIDIIVTFMFNTLNRVLRRKLLKEITQCIKHVGISFVILAMLLFSTKQGAAFSRVTTYMTYGVYLILIIVTHLIWKSLLRAFRREKKNPQALLVTTSGYADEGIGVVESAGMTVKGIFITDKTNEGKMGNIPAIVDRQDAAAFLCWKWVDKVYVCGPENIDVPEVLINSCQQMDIPVFITPARKNFNYEIVRIRTSLSKDDKSTGLSFFEAEHDIPFRISRFYTIFESEQDHQKGFHPHKQSWHLLFCPYGDIEVIIDTGKERKTISLSDPDIGLILHPSVWREMIWKKSGSVLCVAASGHYEANKLRNDYNAYLKFLQEREWSATVESAEIMGEMIS